MIKGERRIDISPEEILRRVSDYDIYRFHLGDFIIGEPFCNPLRTDNHPSMVVRQGMTELYHQDFADDRFRGNCFSLVQQKHWCDFRTALLRIDQDMELGITSGIVPKRGEKPVVITWGQPKIRLHKPPKLAVITRKPTAEELRWYGGYFLDIADLKADHVYFPRTIYRNYRKLSLSRNDLVICYHYPELGNDYWKIYRPLQGKSTKDTPMHKLKWDSNIPFTHASFLDFQPCEVGGLIKSRKDRRVVMKATGITNLATFEGESPAAITDATLQYVRDHCQRQLCISDNDEAGRKVSEWAQKEQGFGFCEVPDALRTMHHWTDFADWAHGAKTLDVITQHFKQKGWIS